VGEFLEGACRLLDASWIDAAQRRERDESLAVGFDDGDVAALLDVGLQRVEERAQLDRRVIGSKPRGTARRNRPTYDTTRSS
jgi:hypothetical protein